MAATLFFTIFNSVILMVVLYHVIKIDNKEDTG